MLQFVMKPEDINSVADFMKFMNSKKVSPMGDVHKATQRLVEVYGDKILPGGALDEELSTDEKFARITWEVAHKQMRENNPDYKKYDTLLEKASTVKYKAKRGFSKLFWGIFIATIFFALIKYIFS